jgi:hypothetical protein
MITVRPVAIATAVVSRRSPSGRAGAAGSAVLRRKALHNNARTTSANTTTDVRYIAFHSPSMSRVCGLLGFSAE